ncbi:MAG: 3-deoxy-D-manno-octulosonic acid transferase [Candidatus Cloacimonetes bacterium]|nr:3-deoxy-D-manno-octulosonic acid transferase [Candidatus Cloacimonadota bacterium]
MFFHKLFTSFFYFLLYPILRVVFFKYDFLKRVTFKKNSIEQSIWIHTASLGEVNAVKPLIKRLLETYPSRTFLLTSVTKAGMEAARDISGKLVVHQFPLDIPHLMKKAFDMFKPRLIILVETELWPCMLHQAYKHNVPVVIINARLMKRSLNGYRFLKLFFRKELSTIKLVCAQSEQDAERFNKLKFPEVIVSSNLKFAVNLPDLDMTTLRCAWQYKENDFIITFGCSRPGEELLAKNLYEKLNQTISQLKIIIAPRHISRIPEIETLFRKSDISVFSDPKPEKPFLIVDEMGVLPQLYAMSNIVIIGGSFVKFGGHNPLEAIWYEKPVIMGEHYQSCKGTVNKFLSDKAIIITNAAKLHNEILDLYHHPEKAGEIGKKAKQIMLDNQHALQNHLQALERFIR